MNIKIQKPQVGIYYVFNNEVITKTRDVKLNNNDISDDAGEMFHYDLIQQRVKFDNSLKDSQDEIFLAKYNEGIKTYGQEGAFKIFLRGRVYYMYNDKLFYIAVPENYSFNKEIRYTIERKFHLIPNHFKFVKDPFYNI